MPATRELAKRKGEENNGASGTCFFFSPQGEREHMHTRWGGRWGGAEEEEGRGESQGDSAAPEREPDHPEIMT